MLRGPAAEVSMSDLARFSHYARAFEVAVLSDDLDDPRALLRAGRGA